MNIFMTDPCPVISAYHHCRVHTRKMIVEAAQLLSTAHRILDEDPPIPNLYKTTHKNHPSAIFARASIGNYQWLHQHLEALCEVYTSDTGKVHATAEKLLEGLREAPINIPKGLMTDIPLAMPLEFQTNATPWECYQKYLNSKFEEWLLRDKPIKVEFYIDTPDWVCDTVRQLMIKRGLKT